MEPLPIILKTAWALPLLPKEKLQEGMMVLEFILNCQGYNIKLTTFVSTLKAWYSQFSTQLSFYDNTEEEAINIAEDFLRQSCRLLGHQKSLNTYLGKNNLVENIYWNLIIKKNLLVLCKKINYWFYFISSGNIVNVLNTSSQQWLSKNEAKKVPRKTFQIKVDNTIRSFQSKLIKKKISTKIFLHTVIDKALAEEILFQLSHKQCKS